MDNIYTFLYSSSVVFSTKVPGVITFITSLLTIPLAAAGSSTCSPMATLYPLLTNLDIYEVAA